MIQISPLLNSIRCNTAYFKFDSTRLIYFYQVQEYQPANEIVPELANNRDA